MIRKSLVAGACVLGMMSSASAQLSPSIDFDPADATRTHMDVAGAWSGSADASTVGDRFQLSVSNTGLTETVFDLAMTVAVPAGFPEITDTLSAAVSGAGICGSAPTITVTRTVDDLEFDAGGYDLPAQCTLTLDFGLLAPSGTVGGTYSASFTAEGASIDAGSLDISSSSSESFMVLSGALVFEKTPAVASAKFGDTVTWTISAENTGLGGLFEVELDESGLGSGFTLTGITPSSPISPAPIVSGSSVQLSYLAPGEAFTADVEVAVAACTGLTNLASVTERTLTLSESAEASVQLELETPNIGYTISVVDVPFGGTGSVSLNITNSGDGAAQNLAFDTSLSGAPLTVDSVSTGWDYNAASGLLSKTGGPFAAGANETVVLTVSDSGDICTVEEDALMSFTANFEDDCGTPFATPAQVDVINFAQAPEVIMLEGGSPRLTINQSGAYTINLSTVTASSLDDDPVEVTHTLPGAIQDGAILSPSVGSTTCSGVCGSGDLVTWSITRNDLSASQSLTIGISASADPCDAGATYAMPASISTTYGSGACPLTDSEGAGFLLSTNPVVGATQVFNQSGSPFETGAPDDGDSIREEGEGEEAEFSASYSFDGSDTGTWAGSTYGDNYGGLSAATLTAGSLEYRLNNGSWTGVPLSALSSDTGSLLFTLDFLASVDSNSTVGGDSLDVRYQLTAPDSVISAGTYIYRDQFATLTVASAGASSDSCPASGGVTYSQGDRVTWRRAEGEALLTLGSQAVDVCGVVDANIIISNETNGFPIRNLLATLDLGTDFELVTPSNPVFSGGLGGGASVSYNDAAPSFTLDDESLTAQGEATIQLRRRATATGQGGAVNLTVDYDDNQTAPAGARVFQSTASDSPFLVNSANLDIFVSPSTLPATTDTVSWNITVRNTAAGTAYNTEISDVVPAGLTMDAGDIVAMDSANAYSASVAGSSVTWDIGDMAPGASVTLTLVASVDGSTCSIPNGTNQVNAEWGCGGFAAQASVNSRPNITFPAGNMEIIHDSTGAYASLCGTGQVVIIARNIGTSEIIDVTVSEDLNTASTGISLVANSVEYSVNDGSSWTPVSGVTPASTLTFDQTDIPDLALLSAYGQTGDEVLIRFGISTNALTNSNANITASGTGSLHCGDLVSSPGSTFSVPVDKPRMRVTKVGRNVTRGGVNGEDVFAVPGDTVEWTVTVQNQGGLATSELRLRDILAGSNGAATISGPGVSQSVTSDYVAITQIPASGSATYTITEVIGASCVSAPNTADVTWGCDAQSAGSASELSSPVDNTDTASLIMIPDASDIVITQSVTDAAGTGALTTAGRVTLQITNNSAPFTAAQITNTLPTGFRFDPSFTPIFTTTDSGSDGYDQVAVNASDIHEPVLTFSRGGSAGYFRNGETVTVEFAIYQDGSLDVSGDPAVREETVGNSDPDVPADSTNAVSLNFESGCGVSGSASDSLSVSPKTPDIDVDIDNPISRIVSGIGAAETFTVTVTNNGDTAAEDGLLEITIRSGWTGATPSGCTGAVPGTLTCDLSGAAALGSTSSRSFDLNLTVDNETGDLGVTAVVTGEIQDAVNADTGGDYSYDEIEAQTLGFRQTLSLQSTSEADFDAASDLQIGEEAVLRIESVWFGAGSALIEDPTVKLDFERLTGFSRISETVVTAQSIAAQTNFGGSDPTAIVYEFADFTGGDTVTIDVTVRALNHSANAAAADIDFVSSASSVFSGVTFDEAATGFPAAAGRTQVLVFERPALTVTKEVRNDTLSGSFSDSATGDAADVFEYRIVLENTGSAPAFDLSIIDAVPAGFTISDFASDGLDNDGDGATDEAQEGGVSGQTITFNRTTANEGDLVQLADGDTLTLLYQVTADATVNPEQVLVNQADYLFDTLDGASGSQTGVTGSNNDLDGAFEDGDTVTATITIDSVALAKQIVMTSVGGDTSADVVVGEQVDFELSLILPAGQVESLVLEDVLPEGLALFSRVAVVQGSGISCTPALVESPASLPASGTPLLADWDFGDCDVSDVPELDRTMTIGYRTQVENIASVVATANLENGARYTHSGLAEPTLATPVEVTIIEPQLILTVVASPDNTLDAGSPVTLTYTLSNTGTAPAFNVDLSTLLNDNGVDDGRDGDVDTAASYGDTARDISVFDCAFVSDTTAAPGDFLYSFDNGDGDNDASDEASDCLSLYRNFSTDGFAAGASLTFTSDTIIDAAIVLETDYLLSALASATSLPSNAAGYGDSNYERSSTDDPTSSARYGVTATDTLSARDVPSPNKTFVATSDANTAPDSGAAVNVAIGETYTAEITYRFDEGITRRAMLRERVRLDGPNTPGDVELLSARMQRTSTGLTSSDDTASINSAATTAWVDVTSLIVESGTGTWAYFSLDVGDITNVGDGASPASGRGLHSLIIEYEMRVRDTSANSDGGQLRDQGQVRPYDGDDFSLGYQSGTSRYATIVEPEFVAAKTSDDVDGILSGNESVTYTLTATNVGTGPAYNTVLEDTLPAALRAGGLSSVTVLIDGAAPAASPVFSYTPATGLARWSFDSSDVVLPGSEITIAYTTVADASIASGSTHTNAFEVAAYYSQSASVIDDRRQSERSNIASVTLGAPEIAFTPDQLSSTQPGSTIIYPHILQVPAELSGGSLSFSQSSSKGLGWQVWYDSDGSGGLSSGDTLWSNGATLPTTGNLQFFVQGQVPNTAHDGWRDITTFSASVTYGSTVLTGQVVDITNVSHLQAGELTAGKFMAVDRDCDGDLGDETASDANFEQSKGAAPGECVIYRITFRNEGTAPVTRVSVKDMTPAYTVYLAGTANYETTPSGLFAGIASVPGNDVNGPMSFPYTGALAAGDEGAVTYGVRIGE